jgi:hypothetical protein
MKVILEAQGREQDRQARLIESANNAATAQNQANLDAQNAAERPPAE